VGQNCLVAELETANFATKFNFGDYEGFWLHFTTGKEGILFGLEGWGVKKVRGYAAIL